MSLIVRNLDGSIIDLKGLKYKKCEDSPKKKTSTEGTTKMVRLQIELIAELQRAKKENGYTDLNELLYALLDKGTTDAS